MSIQIRAEDHYAGFWERFSAMFIDSIILTIGGYLIGVIFGLLLVGLGVDLGTIQTNAEGFGSILGIVEGWLYYTLLESSTKQATLGKMIMGIFVTDLNGNRISFGRANGRYWGKCVSFITLYIGFIMAGFTQKKQALHDIMAGTLLIKKD